MAHPRSFFMIHPHLDPLPDGPHVFVLGLLSGAVLTFTPTQQRSGLEAEQRSWSDQDLDVLLRRRSLVGFTGPARYTWRHGIRGGMELRAKELGEQPVVCDFWGSMRLDVSKTSSPEGLERLSSPKTAQEAHPGSQRRAVLAGLGLRGRVDGANGSKASAMRPNS